MLRDLPAFEQTYRNDHDREHAVLFDASGHLIVERTGDADSVTFSSEELNRACLGTLSHSHPRGKPFSAADLSLGATYGLALRAVGSTPDGKAFDYTVRFNGPSAHLAGRLEREFNEGVEQAESLLKGKYDNPWRLEREARHAVITTLAHRYGFAYERRRKDAPLSETTRHERHRLDVFASLESAMQSEVWGPLRDSLVRLLTRHTAPDGRIPLERQESIRQSANRLVQRTLLGAPRQDGELFPYRIQDGQVVPHSAYFKTLWSVMQHGANAAIRRHGDLMRRYLPADLIRALEMATVSPFDRTVSEEEGPQYDPLHLWVGPDGKRLSDRIWNATGDMRRKLDDYLTRAIASRQSVPQIAAGLEEFLQPDNGPYEAMRLARTEVAAANARADFLAAQGDPFVETYSFFTAPSHQCCDECDLVQSGSPYPKDDATHLPPRHPNCICGVVWNIVKNVAKVIQHLRDQIADAVTKAKTAFTDLIGPLSKRFLDLLFRGRP